MFVRLLMGRAGDRFSQSPGEVIEVGEEEGQRMIEAGQCVRSAPETASVAHGENAARPRGRPRKVV